MQCITGSKISVTAECTARSSGGESQNLPTYSPASSRVPVWALLRTSATRQTCDLYTQTMTLSSTPMIRTWSFQLSIATLVLMNYSECRRGRRRTIWNAHDFLCLLYCFIVLLCICVVSSPYVIYYPTVMARYSLAYLC